jgi:protein arginine kinase activator
MKEEEPEKGAHPKPLLPERSIECSECRRPIAVCYTEIVGKTVTKIGMCEECPLLRRKLHGQAFLSKTGSETPTSICCGGCGLTHDEVKMGASLGCPLCYEIFSEDIFHELAQLEKLPPKYAAARKIGPLHAGRIPGQQQQVDPSLKLVSLQQALHETLGREDYEQAAWLRDQIKSLEEQSKGQRGSEEDGRKN